MIPCMSHRDKSLIEKHTCFSMQTWRLVLTQVGVLVVVVVAGDASSRVS
jgi:hypothetical protein